ncbi:hypothetical protein LY76DRAFT_75982 [Colletotrichum caudatum]|nr:hypothetical protein LY76DRAFT_75982 [Colletotrichum caudatum]
MRILWSEDAVAGPMRVDEPIDPILVSSAASLRRRPDSCSHHVGLGAATSLTSVIDHVPLIGPPCPRIKLASMSAKNASNNWSHESRESHLRTMEAELGIRHGRSARGPLSWIREWMSQVHSRNWLRPKANISSPQLRFHVSGWVFGSKKGEGQLAAGPGVQEECHAASSISQANIAWHPGRVGAPR